MGTVMAMVTEAITAMVVIMVMAATTDMVTPITTIIGEVAIIPVQNQNIMKPTGAE